MKFCVFPWEYPDYSEKSLRLGLFYKRIQQGLLQIPNTSSIRPILIRKSRIIGKIYILFLGCSPDTEYIEYSPYSDRKTRIIGKFYTFYLYLFTTGTEHIDCSTDSGRITRIFGLIVKSSFKMAKIAIPAQEFSEKSEKSIGFCALIEKINCIFFVAISRIQPRRSSPISGKLEKFPTQ